MTFASASKQLREASRDLGRRDSGSLDCTQTRRNQQRTGKKERNKEEIYRWVAEEDFSFLTQELQEIKGELVGILEGVVGLLVEDPHVEESHNELQQRKGKK